MQLDACGRAMQPVCSTLHSSAAHERPGVTVCALMLVPASSCSIMQDISRQHTAASTDIQLCVEGLHVQTSCVYWRQVSEGPPALAWVPLSSLGYSFDTAVHEAAAKNAHTPLG